MVNSDKVAAWLRTVVPVGWGALVAFLLSRFPAIHDLMVNPAVVMVVTGIVVTAWYSLWRWLEPRLPAWATVLVMGYDRPPVYFPGEIYDNGVKDGLDLATTQQSVTAGLKYAAIAKQEATPPGEVGHYDPATGTGRFNEDATIERWGATAKALGEAWEQGRSAVFKEIIDTGQIIVDGVTYPVGRPVGETSGPHGLTEIIPAVRDETGGGEDQHRG